MIYTNKEIISVPKDLPILEGWRETPVVQNNMEQVAKSIFADWKTDQLGSLSRKLNVCILTLGAGACLSIYLVTISGIILCGVGITICLICKNAIYKEQVNRCKAYCLKIERWFLEFINKCEELKNSLHLPNNQNVKIDLNLLTPDACKNLIQILNQFPSLQLVEMGEELRKHHHQIFGEWRKVGQNYWSSYWIRHHFSDKNVQFNTFFSCRNLLKIISNEYEKDPQQKQKDILTILNTIFNELFIRNPPPNKPVDEVGIKAEMYLLTDRLNASAQGLDNFPTLIDRARYWQQNIAIFRSSLA